VRDGDRVVGADDRARGVEQLDEREGRGVAQVVGAALERQAEQADRGAAQHLQVVLQLLDDALALALVDVDGALDDVHGVAVAVGGGDDRARVLAEAAAAPADAGVQEARADALVEADRAGDLGDVGADRSARPANSLMKLILVARNELAAYLVSSALVVLVVIRLGSG
jgi:hypothetical protein